MCVLAIRAFALSCKKKKAVLTIETAVVLPLFLIAMLLLMSLCLVNYVDERICSVVSEESKLEARNIHDGRNYGVSGIEADIRDKLGDGFLNSGIIKGGAEGLDFSNTDISSREIIIVSVKYTIKLPFDLFGVGEIDRERKVTMHSWTGYENGLMAAGNMSEYVYMTDNGSVYHRTRECSHIRLNIHVIDGNTVKTLRNSSGGKYKKCIYCKPDTSEAVLYITEDGDRYHNTLSCSGLKRSVYRVKLSEIGGIQPCKRCGY